MATAALRQIDGLIERIEKDLDGALADVSAAIARMDAGEGPPGAPGACQNFVEVTRPVPRRKGDGRA